jgi:hypothetical protein
MIKLRIFLFVMVLAMAYLTSCKKESSIRPELNKLGLRDTVPTDSIPGHHPHDTIPHVPHDTVPFPPHDSLPDYPVDTTTYPPYYPPIDSIPTHDTTMHTM